MKSIVIERTLDDIIPTICILTSKNGLFSKGAGFFMPPETYLCVCGLQLILAPWDPDAFALFLIVFFKKSEIETAPTGERERCDLVFLYFLFRQILFQF